MPEGHTLHRLAADLAGTYVGRQVRSSSPQGRFEAAAARLDRRVLEGAEAYGKHLFVSFEGTEEQVHVHLGLYGTFLISPGVGRPVVGQVRWRLEAQDTADLRGPNACELLTPPAVEQILGRLGPDPLRADADPDLAWHRIHRSDTPIAALLMDQKVLAGVGNVYRAEVLFRQRVAPMTAGRRIPRVRWDAMWADLVALMQVGVERGRIDTVRPEHEPQAMGRDPRADDHGGEVYVYRRDGQPCLVCGTPVRRRDVAGRNLFWCPSCQQRR
ncbi:Fpg/Nei family DNA glycosylase [Aeromicrobium sp. SMF47]|uniref:Fpg/Nei family DNA glycosylase n=1 Tax=Aeromicrobium TaxID=2040 RepID=UPI00129DBFB4|nr:MULTISPECIES: DNA-formamidopyrimidine glycosylase family protein [Aeromicrobium]MRJ78136.1 Fpg/Nei family DNA glycosylase [Aeromicrobium yanjiei]MRK03232.1 Fpg/Nei family DNA glycosylase [Aeromicrobium sp. S22]